MCKRESFINYRLLRMALWKTHFFFFNLKNIFTFRVNYIQGFLWISYCYCHIFFYKFGDLKQTNKKHTQKNKYIVLHLCSPEVRNQLCWAKSQVSGWLSFLQRSEVLTFPALREAYMFLTHGTFIFSQQNNILKFLSILGLALPSVF